MSKRKTPTAGVPEHLKHLKPLHNKEQWTPAEVERVEKDVERGKEIAESAIGRALTAPSPAKATEIIEKWGRRTDIRGQFSKAYLHREFARQGLTLEELVAQHLGIIRGGKNIRPADQLNAIKLAYQAAGLLGGDGGTSVKGALDVSSLAENELVKIIQTVEVRKQPTIDAEAKVVEEDTE